jgi:hypothetical protein
LLVVLDVFIHRIIGLAVTLGGNIGPCRRLFQTPMAT